MFFELESDLARLPLRPLARREARRSHYALLTKERIES